MILLVLLIIGMPFVYANITTEHFVELVVAVRQHFTSGCVYLLHNHAECLETTMMTVQVGKLMFEKYIQTTLVSRVNGSMGCQHNRPLYVATEKYVLNQTYESNAIWLKILVTQSISEHFADKDIAFDCELLVAEVMGNYGFTLTEVYRISPTLPLQTIEFGKWTLRNGLTKPKGGFYDRRKNLQGAFMLTAVYKESTLVSRRKTGKDVVLQKDFFYEVWLTLRELMNFTSKYLMPEFSAHGVKAENGSWNGILGLIQRNEADVTCEDLSMSLSRAEIVDFMVPLQKDRQYVLVRKTNTFELSWGSFLLPFSTEIWFAVIVTIVVMALILWMVYVARHHYWNERMNQLIVSFHLRDSFFYIFGTFCQQGYDIMPYSTPGRMVSLVSYLTAVVLLAGYSGSLISHLTLRKPVIPFTGFGDLLHDGTYQFGVMPFSSIFTFFKESKDPLMHELYTKFIHPHEGSLPEDVYEGLHRVCKSYKYAFMSTLADLDNKNLTCRVIEVPEAYLPGSRAMAMRRGSPYLDLFSHFLLKLYSSGILRRLKLLWTKKQPFEESLFVAMDITSVAPIFAILVVGILVAIFLLLVELIAKFCWLKRKGKDVFAASNQLRRDSFKYFHIVYSNGSKKPSGEIHLRL